jgi:exopolysaccharide biosynthesis polyprenyl glycosylphosphotransferase
MSVMSWRSNVGILIAALCTVLALGAIGAYGQTTRIPGGRLRATAHLALVGCASAVIAALISAPLRGTVEADRLALVALVLPAAWIAARIVVAAVERSHPESALIIGTGATASHVWALSERHRECAFEVIGFVDDDPLSLPAAAPPTLGALSDLPRLVAELGIERVIVAYANAVDADLLGILRTLDPGVRVQVVPRLFELVQARGFELGRISMLEAGGSVPSPGEHRLKRTIDIVMATLMLVVASPLLLAIAIAIKFEDRGPVLFRQRRVGQHNEVFEMVKFRTMSADAERRGYEMIEGLPIERAVHELKARSAELHVTHTGRRLRALSLDELPQLWNVIRGQMALVGPRPMPEYEIDGLAEWQLAVRHAVRPGITGLWQVSGRSSISWDERVQLDCVYARHWSVTTDMRILARTVAAVVRTSNAG